MASAPTRSPVASKGPTGRTPWSLLLLQQWAQAKYPGFTLSEQVRLGPTSAELVGVTVSPALEAMLRVNNWYADGLLILPNEVLIIESKMQADPRAVGQVLFYLSIAGTTPLLSGKLHLPFVPVVLFAESDHQVERFARGLGVRPEVFTPSWISDYLTQYQFRTRSTAPSIPPTGTEGT